MNDRYKFLALENDAKPLKLREPFSVRYSDEAKYKPAPGLCEAIDSAMLLGMPLLLTGEPGTGKTQAARWLAWQLGAPLLRQDVKSTTSGKDVLYSFDEVARFRYASLGEAKPLIEFITFSALGEAIIRTLGGSASLAATRKGAAIPDAAFGDAKGDKTAHLLPNDTGFENCAPQHCVVLIDELDKAPRDTPNDLLAEVESMAFDIPELGVRIAADPKWRPIVIITSNSERTLPEPFLRRCLFFDIPSPSEAVMAEIVEQSFDTVTGGSMLFKSSWKFFSALRNQGGIRKKPSTSEFLSWTDCLLKQGGFSASDHLGSSADHIDRIVPTLACLCKSNDDFVAARGILKSEAWRGSD